MADKIQTTNVFRTADPERLKKAVTEKVVKIINCEARKQAEKQAD